MASAAAVAADQALSPEPVNFADPEAITGTVTSAILPSDAPVPDDLNEDDEDEDVVPRSRPRGDKVNADLDEASDLGADDDLFGEDEDEEEAAPTKSRTLDDEELDSGDDQGRSDRVASEAPAEEAHREDLAMMEASISRQYLPEPSDGEMYLTKVPRFLSIDPKAWHHTTYQPPTTDHHSNTASATFSAYNTALSTVHWRRSPRDPSELQSNARVLRWSDGSFTLQLASNPTQQYEIQGNPLAPRQRNPPKPTPTSMKPTTRDVGHDSYTYLTVPDPTNSLLRISHKITAGLSIMPSAATTDDALERLQSSLAAIAQGKNKSSAGGIELVAIDEDPDLARKKAEVAEKEKLRAQKRREAAENRDRDRSNRTLGRSGLGGSRYGAGGLNAAMLEDDELGGGTRPRAKKPKAARRQRRNSEYSEDEDFGRKMGNFKEDEYDEEDEFIARSDEEEEAVESEDEDDGIIEEGRKRSPKRSPKRKSPEAAAAADDDEDAEGEEEEEEVVQSSRVKRRRVVDEDEDDE